MTKRKQSYKFERWFGINESNFENQIIKREFKFILDYDKLSEHLHLALIDQLI